MISICNCNFAAVAGVVMISCYNIACCMGVKNALCYLRSWANSINFASPVVVSQGSSNHDLYQETAWR